MSRNRRRLEIVFSFGALLLLGGGCATFRGAEYEHTLSLPRASAPQPTKTIWVLVAGESRLNGKEQEVSSRMLNTWREETLRAYRDSGLFSQVTSAAGGESDLRAEVKIVDNGRGSTAMAFLSGLTFTLLPVHVVDELQITTTFRNAEGDVLGTYARAEALSTWIQLFMVFAMPTHGIISTPKAALRDLNLAILGEAFPEGVPRGGSGPSREK